MSAQANTALFAIHPDQIPDQYEERAIKELEGAISLPKVLLDVQKREDIEEIVEPENLRRLYESISDHRDSSISNCMYELMLESTNQRVLNFVMHFNYLLMKSKGPDDFLASLRSELEPTMRGSLNQDFLLNFLEHEMVSPRYESKLIATIERL